MTPLCSRCHERDAQKSHRWCAECAKEEHRQWYAANRDAILEKRRLTYPAVRASLRAHYAANRDAVRARKDAWNDANRERIREYGRRSYQKEKASGAILVRLHRRYKSDPLFRLRSTMRTRLYKALKAGGGSKRGRAWQQMVGYTADELRHHIERLFEPWMSWENYGSEWHVDHKRPVALFDLNDDRQVRECFALANLQPLRVIDNQKKGARRVDA